MKCRYLYFIIINSKKTLCNLKKNMILEGSSFFVLQLRPLFIQRQKRESQHLNKRILHPLVCIPAG